MAPHFFNPFLDTVFTDRNLPHWHQSGVLYFVTFRLGDSLPREKLDALRQEREAWLNAHTLPLSDIEKAECRRRFSDRIDAWLDAGAGSCCLADPVNAAIVAQALAHFDGQRYELGEWVVMPNHVHVVLALLKNHGLPGILHSWKSFTAKLINRQLKRTGKLWQEESYDHLIRNERELWRINEYIRLNPEKARVQALSGKGMLAQT